MSNKNCFLSLFLLVCQIIFGQKSVVLLNQVLVNDYQLKNYTNTKSKQELNDSIIQKNQASLTSLLNYNSVNWARTCKVSPVSLANRGAIA